MYSNNIFIKNRNKFVAYNLTKNYFLGYGYAYVWNNATWHLAGEILLIKLITNLIHFMDLAKKAYMGE